MAYEDMNVVQLRDALKRHGKTVYGTRAELVDRLAKAEAEAETDEPDPDEPKPPPAGSRAVYRHVITVSDDSYLSDEAWQAANKTACLREADARQLLPVGGVDTVQVDTEYLPDGRVRLTYTAPVARSS